MQRAGDDRRSRRHVADGDHRQGRHVERDAHPPHPKADILPRNDLQDENMRIVAERGDRRRRRVVALRLHDAEAQIARAPAPRLGAKRLVADDQGRHVSRHVAHRRSRRRGYRRRLISPSGW